MTGLFTLLASVGLATQQAYGLVEGYVRSAGTDEPLANGLVTVVGGSAHPRVLTDSTGRYRLPGLPAGKQRIRATRIGYTPLEVELIVPPAGRMLVDFLLPLRPVSMPPVVAEADASPPGPRSAGDGAEDTDIGERGTGAVRVVDATTGISEFGILAGARALQRKPRQPRGQNVLFVRGAGANLNLVLLDGAPVHTPFHLGGLLERPVPEAIARATRFQGGAPARFDGGLSDVLQLETHTGSTGRPRTAAFADMVSAGGLAEGGLGERASILAAGRTLHGAASGPFLDEAFPQRYTDGLARIDLHMGAGGDLSATGFFNRESVNLGGVRPSSERAEWGNTAASLRYVHAVGRSIATLGAAFGEFRTDLPLGTQAQVQAAGRVRRTRITADVARLVGPVRLGYGAQVERMRLRTRFSGVRQLSGDSVRLVAESQGDTYSGYVDGAWNVSDDIRLGAGLRVNLFTEDRGHSLSPRVRAEWRLARGVALDLSAGRFHQLVVAPDTAVPLSLAFFTAGDGGPLGNAFTDIRVAESSQFVLGLGHEGPGLELRLEGYWKTLAGVPGAEDERLRSTGIDVWLRHGSQALSLWATYTMAWAWAEGEPGLRSGIFSGRHFLRGGAATLLAGRFRLEGDLAFGAGLEFGALPGPSFAATGAASDGPAGASLSNVDSPGESRLPDPAYLRLNLRLTALMRTRILGVETKLYPYVRVINALGRADALFYQFDGEGDGEPRAVGDVPLLPVLGIEWRM
ncbi:MAG: carboxypeptidase regulatory-like domain-containing protein [Gemmatimonadota bacterium]